MGKWIALSVALIGLVVWDARLGSSIGDAHAAALAVQLKLDDANVEIGALTKRVKELEDMKGLDEQRIAELEARVCHVPGCSR